MWVVAVEFGAGQFYEYFFDEWWDLVEHVLEIFDFFFLFVDVLLNFDSSFFIFGGIIQYSLFFLVVFFELFVLGSEVLVDID